MLKVLLDILLAIDTGDLSARCSWTCPRPSTQSTTVFCSDDWRLHWLDIPERVNLTTVTGVCSARRQCTYQCCIPVSQVATRRHTLRCTSSTDRTSTSSQHLRSAGICCGWSYTMFNTLPDDLRDPAVSTTTVRQSLKTHLFSAYQHV